MLLLIAINDGDMCGNKTLKGALDALGTHFVRVHRVWLLFDVYRDL